MFVKFGFNIVDSPLPPPLLLGAICYHPPQFSSALDLRASALWKWAAVEKGSER